MSLNTFGNTFGSASGGGFGSIAAVRAVTTAAGTTTGLSSDGIVIFTGSTTQTYNLPTCQTGKSLAIKNRSTGAVTVARSGSDTIDGATTSIVLASNDGCLLFGNSSDWSIL